MASTIEMFLGTTALIVNSFVLIIMAFVNAVVLGPILSWAGSVVTGPQAVPMWGMTWLPVAIFGLLGIYEIVLVIAYFVITGRRGTVDDYLG